MQLVFVIGLILATWRLTELIVYDRLFEPVRKRWPLYLWTCTRCVSIWASLICVGLYMYVPWLNVILALSWTFGFQNMVVESIKTLPARSNGKFERYIKITMDGSGHVNVENPHFSAVEMIHLLKQIEQAAIANQQSQQTQQTH